MCTDRRLASGARSGTYICHVFAALKWRRSCRSAVNVHDQNATAELVQRHARPTVGERGQRTASEQRTSELSRGGSACGQQAWQVARVHVAQPDILLYCG